MDESSDKELAFVKNGFELTGKADSAPLSRLVTNTYLSTRGFGSPVDSWFGRPVIPR
jgi:hypothetical protein